jgi:hypothetical protein
MLGLVIACQSAIHIHRTGHSIDSSSSSQKSLFSISNSDDPYRFAVTANGVVCLHTLDAPGSTVCNSLKISNSFTETARETAICRIQVHNPFLKQQELNFSLSATISLYEDFSPILLSLPGMRGFRLIEGRDRASLNVIR